MTWMHASSGLTPCRISSTQRKAPQTLMLASPRPDKKNVIRVIHHGLGDQRGCCDVFNRGDRAGAPRWPVHHRCVELDYAIFVGQASDAHGLIFGIEFLNVDGSDGRVERIGAL